MKFLRFFVDWGLDNTPSDIILLIMEQTRGHKAKARLDEIKSLYKMGRVSDDEAKELAFEPLSTLNEEMARIAKEFGKKHRIVQFTGFMR